MKTREKGKADGAYFTDTHSPGHVLTLEQLDYDNAKFPMDPRDQAAIRALAPGETYVVRYAEEDDNGEAPTWGTITRLPADTTVRALVRNGDVLGMGFDDAAAHKDAVDRSAAPLDLTAGEYVDGTLAALSGWTDILIGPEYVLLDYDGRVHRIDVDDVAEEDKGTPNDPAWYRDDEEHGDAGPGAEPSDASKLVKAGDSRGLWRSLLAALPRCSNECGRAARFRMTYTSHFSCGLPDRGCEAPDGDEWEEAPWKAHVELPSDVPARGPYTMRWADDLGNDTPGVLIGEHMPLADVIAWLDTHEDVGTFEIVDEADGRPACGLDTGLAGGAVGCECHRCVPILATDDEPGIRASGLAVVLAHGGQAGRYFEMSARAGGTPVCFGREEALALAEYLRTADVDARPLKLTSLHAAVVDTGVQLRGDPTLDATFMVPTVLPRADCEGVAAFLVAMAPQANALADLIGADEAASTMAGWRWRGEEDGSAGPVPDDECEETEARFRVELIITGAAAQEALDAALDAGVLQTAVNEYESDDGEVRVRSAVVLHEADDAATLREEVTRARAVLSARPGETLPDAAERFVVERA